MIIGALALSSLWATPALAQPVSDNTGTARVRVLEPLAIFKVDDLEFGTIIADPTLPGVVTIPADGSPRVTATVIGVASDPGYRAEYTVVGDPGSQIIVTHTIPPTLNDGSGNVITVLGITLDGLPLRTLDPVSGVESLYFGGSLLIAPNQPEGVYEANFTVTVDYR